MSSRYRHMVVLALSLALTSVVSAVEAFHGSFAEPRDGGNLDLARSHFDGTTAYLVARGHESEALGAGRGARRWRNLLFALRGVKGKIVTFRLPARPVETGDRVHNMDGATVNLIEPVWSYGETRREWQPFEQVDAFKPDAVDQAGVGFPEDSVPDRTGRITLRAFAPRLEDYGWVFRNPTPFTEDVVYVSINEHYPVGEFYAWLESSVLAHAWVAPTASEVSPGTCLIGYQSGGVDNTGAFSRTIEDAPLYGFQIREPGTNPAKVVMLVSGQHPYEGHTKAALQGALEWILDPTDPAAAAYRAEHITLVYPFVNPTGELAGLWRGTAHDVTRDINRNWHTTLTDPAADRGIDTVIIHKLAMQRDVAALGRGQPYAVVDLHQNFGDQLPALDYILHNTNPLATAFVTRLRERVDIADIVSNPSTTQTLRGLWQFAGAGMTLCVERSTYSTIAAERAFGRELMRAFGPGGAPASLAPALATAEVNDPDTASAANAANAANAAASPAPAAGLSRVEAVREFLAWSPADFAASAATEGGPRAIVTRSFGRDYLPDAAPLAARHLPTLPRAARPARTNP